MQFSKHAELKTKQANDAAQHALSYANGLVEGAAASGEDAKTVLRVMVDAVLFPINVDTLHKVCTVYMYSTERRLCILLYCVF